MKKYLLLAAAVVAMASCTKTEPVTTDNDLKPISFENFVHKSTKAAEASASSIQTNGFKVSAYYTPASGTAGYYFQNYAVSYNTTDAVYPTEYFWPIDGTMDFYAVYPAGKTISDKTIADYSTNGAEDLLAAMKTGENCATHNTTKTAVALEFGHLLTQVYFEIKGSDAVNNFKVEKIVLEAKDVATYTYSTGAWIAPATAKTYTYKDSQSSPVTFNGADYAVYGTKSDNSLMLIPQNNVTVKVYYTVETASGVVLAEFNEDDDTNSKQCKSFVASSSTVTTDVDWAKGTTVKYQLILPANVNPIEFTATAAAWTEGTQEVELN